MISIVTICPHEKKSIFERAQFFVDEFLFKKKEMLNMKGRK